MSTCSIGRLSHTANVWRHLGALPDFRSYTSFFIYDVAQPVVLSRLWSMDTQNSSDCLSTEKKAQVDSPTQNDTLDCLPKGARLMTIFVGLVLSVFLVALDLTIISTAIPRITDSFRNVTAVGWYGSAFFLTNAVFQSTWGKAYTHLPLKAVFLASVAVFEVGSLLCGVAPNSNVLIAGRAVAGLGGAGITTGSFTIIAIISPPKDRPIYIGVLGSTYGVASIVGPLLGGAFTEFTTWRWCFWINLPLGAVAALIICICFQNPDFSRPPKTTNLEKFQQMDPIGATVIIGGVVCYLLAMRWGGIDYPWKSARVISTLILFGLSIVAFSALELKLRSRAMVQLRLLKDKIVLGNLIYIFFLAGIYFPLLYFLPIQFQAVNNDTAAHSGIRLIALVLTISICTVGSNVTIAKTGHSLPFLFLGPAIAAVGTGMLYTMDEHSSGARWTGYQIITGMGIGVALQVPMVINQSRVAPADIPAMIATTLFFEIMGACVFVSACEAALSNRLAVNIEHAVGLDGVSASDVLHAGATRLVEAFGVSDARVIRGAYVDALRGPHLIVVVCACVSAVLSIVVISTHAFSKRK